MNKNYKLKLTKSGLKEVSLYKVGKWVKRVFLGNGWCLLTSKMVGLWKIFRDYLEKSEVEKESRRGGRLAIIYFMMPFSSLFSQGLSFGEGEFGRTHADEVYEMYRDIRMPGREIWNSFEPDVDMSDYGGGKMSKSITFEKSQEILRAALQYRYGLLEYYKRDSIWQERVVEQLERGVYPLGLVDLRYLEINPLLMRSGFRIAADSSRYELNLEGFVAPILTENYICAAIIPVERMRSDVEWMVLDSNLWLSNFHKPEKVRIRINSTTMWVEWNVAFRVPSGLNELDIDIDLLLDEEDERGQFLEDPIQWNPFKYFSRCKAGISINAKVQAPVLNPMEIGVYEYSNFKKSALHKAQYTVHFGYSDSTGGGSDLHDCIRKPLVIVEGVDYGYPGIRGLRDGKHGENGYVDILHGKSWNAMLQVWEDWKSIKNGPYMISKLRKLGYDIIYVDFYDGAADININSDVLQGVLEKIKQMSCGNSMHVVGISMGGLVAKRALRRMELEGDNHCVTSFTSVDVPYLGANIPMGLQHVIRYYSKSREEAKDGLHRILRRPATLQMLVNHESSNKQHHSYRGLFMREDSLLGGFPVKPLLFAISNGAGRGTDSRQADAWGSNAKMQPGQLIFRLQLKGLSALRTSPWIDVFAENFYDKKNQVYYSGKVFGKKPFYTSKDNHLWDHLSGSRINKFGSLRRVSKMLKVGLEAPYTCFIPTASALSLSSNTHTFNSLLDYPLSVKLYDMKRPLGDEIKTPFVRIYIPKENEDHVMLDSSKGGNIDWMIAHLVEAERGFQMGMGGILSRSSGVYNLNSAWNRFIPGGKLTGNAVLEINGLSEYPPKTKSDLELVKSLNERHYYTGNCSFTYLKLEDESRMEIGFTGGGITTVHWDGKSVMELNDRAQLVVKENHVFRIKKGSRLIFDEQSILDIRSGGQLIIEEGGWLILRGKSKLILDKESKFHVQGNLVLGDEYVFKPERGASGNVGLVKISNKGYGFGSGEVHFEGANAEIELGGNGRDGVGSLQIEGVVKLPEAKNGNPLKRVRLSGVHGIFAPGSRMILSGFVDMDSTRFVMVDWSNQMSKGKNDAGVRYDGGELKMAHMLFEGLDTAIVTRMKMGSQGVLWQNLEFRNCNIGLASVGLKGRLDQCKFLNNSLGMVAHDIDEELVVTEADFRGNIEGVVANQWSQMKGKMWLMECVFDRNGTGVNSLYGQLILKCNRFNLSGTDVVIEGGLLNLSNTQSLRSVVLGRNEKPGYNVFMNSKQRCLGVYGSELYMNGGNYFYYNKVKYDGRPFIEGQIVVDEAAEYWNMVDGRFNSGANVWSPSEGLVASDLDEQYIQLKRQNRSGGVLDVEGSLLKYYPAEACIYANELNPNELVTQKLNGEWSEQKKGLITNRVFGVAGGIMIWGKGLDWECFNAAGSLICRGKTEYDREFISMSSGIYFIRLKETGKGESFKVFVSEN